VYGTLAGASPHHGRGLGVAFLVSVYIAHQLERYPARAGRGRGAVRRNESASARSSSTAPTSSRFSTPKA